jgi:ERCC4-related helicase
MKNHTNLLKSSIIDNRKRGIVGDFLAEKINTDAKLSFVSAYFSIFAYHHQKIKSNLDGINHLRFLFGEPAFIKSLAGENKNLRNAEILDDSLTISANDRLSQKSVAAECAEWLKNKAEIRSMVKPNFLHGKLYLVENANGVKEGIAGSSNFTVNGLGLGNSPNMELNLIVNDRRDLDDLENWFDEIWNDDNGLVEDVKEKVLEYLSLLSAENQPQFIYYKTLFHIFGDYLREQAENRLLDLRGDFFESEIWNMLYDFQKDGVKGAINRLNKHNGCIIADSVGLGKTFEALAVIQYFERLNYRVLVLCPKNLSANWTIYQTAKNSELNPFEKDSFKYNVLYHTDLGRTEGKSNADGLDLANFKWSNYDLVVIDESHNFRGNPISKIKDDGTEKLNRAKWLMEKIIKEGVKTKVLLLSATPVNNDLRDLRNQILLITEGKNDALFEKTNIRNISSTLEIAQKRFSNWADKKKNPNRTVKQLLELLDSAFFKLLDELTIARSRQHIKSFYDLNAIGGFSKRLKPLSVYAEIDLKDRFFSYDSLNKKILDYKLSVFNPSKYVLEGFESKYGIKTKEEKEKEKKEREERKKRHFSTNQSSSKESSFDQSDREHYLIGMMKVNFLKRLESSIESFEISMKRTFDKIEKLENDIKEFQQKQLDNEYEPLFAVLDAQKGDVDIDELEVGKKLKFKLKHLNLENWLKDLKSDKDALYDLFLRAKDITPDRDAKLKQLKELIENKVKNPINDDNKKVLVFTAFADTAEYLYENLKDWAKNGLRLNIALISGTNTKTTFGKNDFAGILKNFSPVSKNRKSQETTEIDILIATDAISEGQNLQDCDYLVNYDIHWNPVRIIQRFGRIDRIGSKNKQIQLVNFWATKDLDNYINLKNRVEARMALVDVTATGEENILNSEQLEDIIEEDLKYRNQQLKRLKEEVLDLEEMSESVSLTDFTLDDFRQDLSNFLNINRDLLESAPLGLYAVVPAPAGKFSRLHKNENFSEIEQDVIKPGVVFCLRQTAEAVENEAVNPLQPFFLVYLRDDGTVRFNFTNSKQVLEIFRRMCEGKAEPFEELCAIFNRETENGKEMSKYSELLKKAVSEIANHFTKRSIGKLTLDRSAVIAPKEKQIEKLSDFELITWLIIK